MRWGHGDGTFSYGPSYVTGVEPSAVHAGDLDGDGRPEVLAGPVPGVSFLAYGTHRYGVKVAGADLDGDGFDEMLTGAGPGSTFHARVRGFDYDGITLAPMPGVDFTAFDPSTTGQGANAAAGRAGAAPGK